MGREHVLTEAASAGGLADALLAHRYELAAAVCSGRRVLDLGDGSDRLAASAASVQEGDGDPLAFLRGLGHDAVEAVVCFRAIRREPDPAPLIAELARLAEGGVRVLLSVPGSAGDGPGRGFAADELRAVIDPLPDPVVLEQRPAEASVIVPAGAAAEEVAGRLEPPEGDEWAAHWIVAVNVPAAELEHATAQLAFVAAPRQTAYVRALEAANAELLRINARLARGWLGKHDAAAGSVMRRLEDQTALATKWKRIADSNDWARRGLEKRLQTRRHRLVDWPRNLLLSLPGMRARLDPPPPAPKEEEDRDRGG